MKNQWIGWLDQCADVITEAHYGPFLNTFLSGLAVGLALALLALLLLLVIERRHRRSGIIVQGETGSMFITPDAVRQFVERTLDEVGEVKLRSMDMQQRGNGACTLSVVVKLAPDTHVQALVDEARAHVIKQVTAKLGVQGALTVNISVRGFDPALTATADDKARQRDEADMSKRHAMTGYPTLSD